MNENLNTSSPHKRNEIEQLKARISALENITSIEIDISQYKISNVKSIKSACIVKYGKVATVRFEGKITTTTNTISTLFNLPPEFLPYNYFQDLGCMCFDSEIGQRAFISSSNDADFSKCLMRIYKTKATSNSNFYIFGSYILR